MSVIQPAINPLPLVKRMLSAQYPIIFCGLLLQACGSYDIAPTRNNDATIRRSVEAHFMALADAAKLLDVERYMQFVDAEKFTGLNADGTVLHSSHEFADILRAEFPAIATYSSLIFDNVKITVINPMTAILVNEYTATVELTSGQIITASGAGTQVWSNTSGQWLLVNVSSSVKP